MTKRKDGLYEQKITINGKRHTFYGKTKAEINVKIRNFKEKEEQGALFADVADEWWEVHSLKLAPNSLKNYKPSYNRAIEHFNQTPIKDIAPQDISNYIKKFSRNRAEKTVKTQLLVLNLIFSYAVENGYTMFNVVRDITIPKNLPKEKRTSPLSSDIEKVKNNTHVDFGMFAYWLLYTGLRRGELLALRWEDVNMKERTITINKSLCMKNGKPFIKDTKTKTSTSVIPIINALYARLEPKKSGIIFTNKYGDYMTDMQFQRRWKKYCDEIEITATPHQFRHAYATMLFENDIPATEAQALLRHAQVSTTMDIYTDLRKEKQKKIFEKVYAVDIT